MGLVAYVARGVTRFANWRDARVASNLAKRAKREQERVDKVAKEMANLGYGPRANQDYGDQNGAYESLAPVNPLGIRDSYGQDLAQRVETSVPRIEVVDNTGNYNPEKAVKHVISKKLAENDRYMRLMKDPRFRAMPKKEQFEVINMFAKREYMAELRRLEKEKKDLVAKKEKAMKDGEQAIALSYHKDIQAIEKEQRFYAIELNNATNDLNITKMSKRRTTGLPGMREQLGQEVYPELTDTIKDPILEIVYQQTQPGGELLKNFEGYMASLEVSEEALMDEVFKSEWDAMQSATTAEDADFADVETIIQNMQQDINTRTNGDEE